MRSLQEKSAEVSSEESRERSAEVSPKRCFAASTRTAARTECPIVGSTLKDSRMMMQCESSDDRSRFTNEHEATQIESA